LKQSTGRTGRPGRRRVDVPHPTDVHVGSRVRLRRRMLGLSQQKLGEAIGLTFQQVLKYERGANRIGASRLQELAEVLDVPVGFFLTTRTRCVRQHCWMAVSKARTAPPRQIPCSAKRPANWSRRTTVLASRSYAAGCFSLRKRWPANQRHRAR
jgi:transcriptional regulator with XRE-family HTH domain